MVEIIIIKTIIILMVIIVITTTKVAKNSNPQSSSDPNPYSDDYNAEPVILQEQSPEIVPMTCLEAKQESSNFYFSKFLLDSVGIWTIIAHSSIPSSFNIFKKMSPVLPSLQQQVSLTIMILCISIKYSFLNSLTLVG
jgi:hypothetical protein